MENESNEFYEDIGEEVIDLGKEMQEAKTREEFDDCWRRLAEIYKDCNTFIKVNYNYEKATHKVASPFHKLNGVQE